MPEGTVVQGITTLSLECPVCPSREQHLAVSMPTSVADGEPVLADAILGAVALECAGCGRSVDFGALPFRAVEDSGSQGQ